MTYAIFIPFVCVFFISLLLLWLPHKFIDVKEDRKFIKAMIAQQNRHEKQHKEFVKKVIIASTPIIVNYLNTKHQTRNTNNDQPTNI
jgi:hypothetical protein